MQAAGLRPIERASKAIEVSSPRPAEPDRVEAGSGRTLFRPPRRALASKLRYSLSCPQLPLGTGPRLLACLSPGRPKRRHACLMKASTRRAAAVDARLVELCVA
jgi:hypothetical protein